MPLSAELDFVYDTKSILCMIPGYSVNKTILKLETVETAKITVRVSSGIGAQKGTLNTEICVSNVSQEKRHFIPIEIRSIIGQLRRICSLIKKGLASEK